MLAPAAPIQPFARFKWHHKANGVQWLIAPDRRHYRPYDVKRDCAIYARRAPKNFRTKSDGKVECRPKRGTKCPTQGSLSAAVGHNRSKAVGRSGARCVGGGAQGRASPSEEKQGVREKWDSQPFHGMIRLSCCVSHRRPGPASTNRTNEYEFFRPKKFVAAPSSIIHTGTQPKAESGASSRAMLPSCLQNAVR